MGDVFSLPFKLIEFLGFYNEHSVITTKIIEEKNLFLFPLGSTRVPTGLVMLWGPGCLWRKSKPCSVWGVQARRRVSTKQSEKASWRQRKWR